MAFNPANILTFSRLVLAPFFVAFFLLGYQAWAFWTFCFASFTDLIDGTVARVFGNPTKIGALWDPIADKVLAQSCFILLLVYGFIPWWFFVLALVRDVVIVGGATYLEIRHMKFRYSAVWASKFGTVFQMAVAILGLLRWWYTDASELGAQFAWWQGWAIIVASVLIVISGFQYVQIGLHALHQRKSRA